MSPAELALVVFGFIGQVLFFMRFILQWLFTERYKKSTVPVSFWYFSIIGSFMLLTYAILIKDPIYILGQSTGAVIYLRNLYLIYKEKGVKDKYFSFKITLILFAYFGMVAVAAVFYPEVHRQQKVSYTGIIFAIGIVAQSMFFLRFLVQWIYSERLKKSAFPVTFWYFSMVGSSLLLIYSVLVHDPVFIAGQSVGLLIYFRNLYFIRLEKRGVNV
ncbi:lipid-A-disaccharide synthase N-terminal domain-containing protein [Deferribacteres bacterium DY0037]